MATYRFYSNISVPEEIEVEADSYNEAFYLALAEASNGYSVLNPSGYSGYFDDIQIEDSYIPEDDA